MKKLFPCVSAIIFFTMVACNNEKNKAAQKNDMPQSNNSSGSVRFKKVFTVSAIGPAAANRRIIKLQPQKGEAYLIAYIRILSGELSASELNYKLVDSNDKEYESIGERFESEFSLDEENPAGDNFGKPFDVFTAVGYSSDNKLTAYSVLFRVPENIGSAKLLHNEGIPNSAKWKPVAEFKFP